MFELEKKIEINKCFEASSRFCLSKKIDSHYVLPWTLTSHWSFLHSINISIFHSLVIITFPLMLNLIAVDDSRQSQNKIKKNLQLLYLQQEK